MTFIRACNGRLYPASRILSISGGVTRRGCGITDVEIEGLGEVEFYTHEVSSFLRQPVTAFAAQAETYILRFDDEDPDGYWKALVIGWTAAQDGKLYPISADGVNELEDGSHFILTPRW